MRSLIKSHRRSDSSTSDGPSDLPRPRASRTTPLTSPLIPQHASNLTPPLTLSGSLTTTMSSPKKLLTPIKKMFGHHSRSNTSNLSPGVLATGDSLNAAVSSSFEPPKGRKKQMKFASSASLSELQQLHTTASSKKQLASSALMEIIHDSLSESLRLPPPKFVALSTYSDSSVETKPSEVMPIVFDKGLGLLLDNEADSVISIVNSEGNFQAKQALSQELLGEASSRGDTEAYYEDDDELRDSDASSQFSFVKDMRGGRNTSVKYYKTKTSGRTVGGSKPGFFQVDDMGYEDEAALSDYDFENNGMDDDDGLEDRDFDDFEGTNRYDDFLDDNETSRVSGLVETDDPRDDHTNELDEYEGNPNENEFDNYEDQLGEYDEQLDDYENEGFDFDGLDDYNEIVHDVDEEMEVPGHLEASQQLSDSASASGPDPPLFSFAHSREQTPELRIGLPEGFASPGDGLTEELLDSYLQNFETPSTVGALARSPFDLLGNDSPSPLINGVTFGSEQKFRSHRISRNMALNRSKNDISEEPEILANDSSLGLGITPAENKRQSIVNMMDLLGSLEEAASKDQGQKDLEEMRTLFEELDKQNTSEKPAKRSLVVNMMNTLANLEHALNVPTETLKKKARNSIADMMKTLAALEIQNEEKTTSSQETVVALLPNTSSSISSGEKKRYSWLSNGEQSKGRLDELTQGNNQFDEDLLDEINQLPEDFDFEDQETRYETNEVPNFYRSNSYNKKPSKAVVDNSYQKNKIETSLKTVTFYRSGSLRATDNLSRTGSVISSTSFHSFNEDEEEFESEKSPGLPKQSPLGIHHNSHLFELSNDSSSHKSFVLEPITESESPVIK